MNFIDKVAVRVEAGNGGNGVVSFRHEKFVDKGGPDGGNGGNGGSIVLRASNNQNTLAAFRYKKTVRAEAGGAGSKRNKHGKSGHDLIVPVPVGTVVITDEDKTLADLTADGQEVIVAKGGRGGFGNAHFVSSRRQAPRIAEKGEQGEALELTLELKLIADIGLVGLPNAGKSTLLGSISNAHPEIADYTFTTLKPNLGVVDIDAKTTLLIADIPGLIEGASRGKGLGDEFLRHVERTSVLVHLIDIYQDDIAVAYKTIQKELKEYRVDLSKRPQIVVLNKIDGLDPEVITGKMGDLQAAVPAKTKLFAISAASKQGVNELLYELKSLVAKERNKLVKKQKRIAGLPVLRLPEDDSSWLVAAEDGKFMVTGRKIERFAARTDFGSVQGVERLRDIMRKMGIMHELVRKGIKPGQKITIGKHKKLTIEY